MALKQENLHDVRMVRRHIGRGKIKRADWNKHVEDLPDIGEMAEESRVLFEHGGAERDGNRS